MIRLSADEVEVVLVALDGMAAQLRGRAQVFGHGRAHLQAARLFALACSVRRRMCAGLVEAVAEEGCDGEVRCERACG